MNRKAELGGVEVKLGRTSRNSYVMALSFSRLATPSTPFPHDSLQGHEVNSVIAIPGFAELKNLNLQTAQFFPSEQGVIAQAVITPTDVV
jgi:hypothetical protein